MKRPWIVLASEPVFPVSGSPRPQGVAPRTPGVIAPAPGDAPVGAAPKIAVPPAAPPPPPTPAPPAPVLSPEETKLRRALRASESKRRALQESSEGGPEKSAKIEALLADEVKLRRAYRLAAAKRLAQEDASKPAPAKPAAVRASAPTTAVAQPVRPAQIKQRHRIAAYSFGLCVFLPVLLLGAYLYIFAANQYASTVGFTVRTEESSSAMDILGGLTNLSSSSSSDTDVLYKYIQSQELIRTIDQTVGLKAMYRKPMADPLFTLQSDATIEDMVDYWQRMVRVFYEPSTGVMEIEVRAFDPNDAQIIARELFKRSSEMINTISAIAREDGTRYAREELDTSIERLKVARAAMTRFRNDTQIVDPTVDLQGQMGLLTSLNSQLAESLIELDILSETTREGDPRIEQTRRKIAVIEKRIQEEREKLGVGVGPNHEGRPYADLVGEFERLMVDQEFAEKAYVSALSSYDSAVAEARRQSRYLAAYVEPTLAERALYPQRAIILMVTGFLLFGFWSVAVLIYYSLRDRG